MPKQSRKTAQAAKPGPLDSGPVELTVEFSASEMLRINAAALSTNTAPIEFIERATLEKLDALRKTPAVTVAFYDHQKEKTLFTLAFNYGDWRAIVAADATEFVDHEKGGRK